MSSANSDDVILIAGGGIAGLSAAIALGRIGEKVRLFERNSIFAETGAGIQLGPNTTRILRDWGVLETLDKHSVRAEGIGMGDGITGEPIARVPLGNVAEQRYGAPYILIHRADLHAGLLEAARTLPNVDIINGIEITGFEQFPDLVIADTGENVHHGKALIGADGIWSTLRNLVDPTAILSVTGKTAWRATLDPGALPDELQGPWTGLWMAPNAHLVHYPVSGGKLINLVAVIQERWTAQEGWNLEADPEILKTHFLKWDSRIRAIIETAQNWRKWTLYDLPPLRRSAKGNVTLIGDAAHPIYPFLAQGGGLAIEDAAILANHISAYKSDVVEAFVEFENQRISRTARTRYESRKMGQIYHMSGMSRKLRDYILRRRSPESLLGKFDWLYGFDAFDH